ncbi:putative oxidoreductase [Dyella sp. OK004]|uniref:DoxX family protein n=1 Tax=Dyella sp. OK004 TaxID=1855292 RepID=UPI0008EE05DE|nr:DoxX family protein [Dyella sp. OK004]SFR91638.1 putative oxidoreductase [Dyella sp. OK004]
MRYTLFEKHRDEVILVARILLMILFVKFGWSKVIGFSGTVTYMASAGLPAPTLSTIIAIVMEFAVGIALALGYFTRPLALILAVYTFATALIGHPYWNMSGDMQYMAMINFYKNISIVGGLLLLCAIGPGKYSLDKR